MNTELTKIQRFIHKQVPFRYSGNNLTFSLSQELFSSFDVDTGTRHLLRSIKKIPMFSSLESILDIGCGTGVLAVSLAKALPQASIYAVDRDVLACEFTRFNARENGVTVETVSGLDASAHQKSFPDRYDLIVSNIPAKAGRAAINRMILNALSLLSEDGVLGVVVISPLKHGLENIMDESGCEVLSIETHPRHTVALMRPTVRPEREDAFPGSYLREKHSFTHKPSRNSYYLTAVYDLPGFDTLPLYASLCSSLMPRGPHGLRHLFWNTEQGHIPLQVLLGHDRPGACTAVLADRDVLALTASRFNISSALADIHIETIYASSADSALNEQDPESLDSIWIYMNAKTDELSPQQLEAAALRLTPGGLLCFTGKSSTIAGVPKRIPGFFRGATKRHSGFRIQTFLKQRV